MNRISFYINYHTQAFEALYLVASIKKGKKVINQKVRMKSADYKTWTAQAKIKLYESIIYEYQVVGESNTRKEGGKKREIKYRKGINSVVVHDSWKETSSINEIFHNDAFLNNLFLNQEYQKHEKRKNHRNFLIFKLYVPGVQQGINIGITGSHPLLNNWEKAIPMKKIAYGTYELVVPFQQNNQLIEYKYVACHDNGSISYWEERENRKTFTSFNTLQDECHLIQDEELSIDKIRWKGAGMAIPIFSLRSKSGFGIGEFADLIPAIDLCADLGFSILQTLPVNDTIATKTWQDSYPYAAISVNALHPLYINIDQVGSFSNKKIQNKYKKSKEKLNGLNALDLEKVLKEKMQFLRVLFDQFKLELKHDLAFQKFQNANADWLTAYAAFCTLRDTYQTTDFKAWKKYNSFNIKSINNAIKKDSEFADNIQFYKFIQFHADKQLKAAKAYGRLKKVVLKGDLPIGIYRYSCDAWVSPHLFNMDEQAGAPPDDYAIDGQNWGFPTYDWKEMRQNDFQWWKNRMAKLGEYFDALRIDHILGFFRIWQIPIHQKDGTLGTFNPRLSYSEYDLRKAGLKSDLRRFTDPYIRRYILEDIFGSETSFVIDEFLHENWKDSYSLKPIVDNQSKIDLLFEHKYLNKQHLKKGLFRLVKEVLLLANKMEQNTTYDPRITLHSTYSFQALDFHEKGILDHLYNEYFYQRHDQYWKQQALEKLPALLDSTDMLICGEDLGMIPNSVPEVMKTLNIIPLEIQRMPKGFSEFGSPMYYDYNSVCSPSCHDMSTIRGWWEGNPDIAQLFFNNHLHRFGKAPIECTKEIAMAILWEHFQSPSILAIFPIQDLLALDDTLKNPDVFGEQINEPSNPKHYWKYRMHINIEELLEKIEWISQIRTMTKDGNR